MFFPTSVLLRTSRIVTQIGKVCEHAVTAAVVSQARPLPRASKMRAPEAHPGHGFVPKITAGRFQSLPLFRAQKHDRRCLRVHSPAQREPGGEAAS
jgi:hypothetical protein